MFVTSPRFLDRPRLYPRQALILKLVCLAPHLLTDYDHGVLEQWGSGFSATGDPHNRRYEGHLGLAPDVLQRITACQRRKRLWFREVVVALGRRAGKNYLTAVIAAYVVWWYLSLDDPNPISVSTPPSNSQVCSSQASRPKQLRKPSATSSTS